VAAERDPRGEHLVALAAALVVVVRRCLRPALAAQRGEERATVCRGIIIPAARIGFSMD